MPNYIFKTKPIGCVIYTELNPTDPKVIEAVKKEMKRLIDERLNSETVDFYKSSGRKGLIVE